MTLRHSVNGPVLLPMLGRFQTWSRSNIGRTTISPKLKIWLPPPPSLHMSVTQKPTKKTNHKFSFLNTRRSLPSLCNTTNDRHRPCFETTCHPSSYEMGNSLLPVKLGGLVFTFGKGRLANNSAQVWDSKKPASWPATWHS